ncbi:MAG: cobalamin biosynthesis protein [Rhizobiaceae bacterium]|nr:cobalamin biosynthesis protein [Rhizobiaceae bacterium]
MPTLPNDAEDLPARRYVLGLGCERGTSPEDVHALVECALREIGITAGQLYAVASIDTRRDEPAIVEVATRLNVPLRVLDAATLERETPRLKNPSDLVFARVGCHGVAEAAALAVAGANAELVLPKMKSGFSTAAIARIG